MLINIRNCMYSFCEVYLCSLIYIIQHKGVLDNLLHVE